MHMQTAGDKIYLVGKTDDDFAGSELQKMMTGKISGLPHAPNLPGIKDYLYKLQKLMAEGLVQSAHDLSEGGLGVSLAESVFDTDLGVNVKLDFNKNLLFSETPGRLIVSVAPENAAKFEQEMGDAVSEIGQVTDDKQLNISLTNDQVNEDVAKLQKIWKECIPCLMKSKA